MARPHATSFSSEKECLPSRSILPISTPHFLTTLIPLFICAALVRPNCYHIPRALYAVEKQAAEFSVAERLDSRQRQLAPALAQLRQELLSWKEMLLHHQMAEAVNYRLLGSISV